MKATNVDAPVANVEQIRALARSSKDRVVVVRARPVWDGPAQITVGTRVAHVVVARTVLSVRAAIADHRTDDMLIVLTDRTGHELGLDVLAKVSRQRVRRLDPWELVRGELGVTGLDPELAAKRWILDALVQHKPAGGWVKPPSGFLQCDEAIRQLLDLWLGLPSGSSLVDLLQWLGTAGSIDKLIAASAETRDGIVKELTARYPAPASLLVDLASEGLAGDLVPLGLAARVVWAPSTDAELIAARVRFEGYTAGRKLPEATARHWADAAETVATEALAISGRAATDPWIVRAQQIVRSCEAQGWLAESNVLADALEQRFVQAGAVLDSVVAGDHAQLLVLEGLLRSIEGHLLADTESERVETMAAAVRLARRLVRAPQPTAATLPALSVRYRDDEAWVDRARHVLRQGDRSTVVAEAFSALLALVDAERELANAVFAEQLRQWSLGEPGASADLVPLEDVLTSVVAPLASLGPVLLVVADGMSWPVAIELLDDLDKQGWLQIESDQRMPIGVSLLPTVTEASRTSLLCGRRTIGNATTEVEGFRSHPALKALSGPAPLLFHKARLSTAGGEALAPDLRAALVDPSQRVVGVVINAIDDHLTRGMQVRVPWTSSTVTPMRELLAEAAAAGRTVILTSDHGHVLDERRSVQRGIADPGERWRTAAAPAGDQEIAITGPRVLLGGGTVVMPTSDTLRYGPSKHGYHGGATPQEVLVPVVVLSRSTSMPEGWGPTAEPAPSWWSAQTVDAIPVPPTATPTAAKPIKLASTGQGSLFETKPPEATPTSGWIATLLASPAFTARRPIMQRRRLDDEMLTRMLTTLDERGCTALKPVLATDVEVPAFRLDGLLSALASVLNVEGYSVLDVRDDTVVLNRALLFTQFGIEG
jgi:hypothetical protein